MGEPGLDPDCGCATSPMPLSDVHGNANQCQRKGVDRRWLAFGIVGGIALPSSSFLRRFAP